MDKAESYSTLCRSIATIQTTFLLIKRLRAVLKRNRMVIFKHKKGGISSSKSGTHAHWFLCSEIQVKCQTTLSLPCGGGGGCGGKLITFLPPTIQRRV